MQWMPLMRVGGAWGTCKRIVKTPSSNNNDQEKQILLWGLKVKTEYTSRKFIPELFFKKLIELRKRW